LLKPRVTIWTTLWLAAALVTALARADGPYVDHVDANVYRARWADSTGVREQRVRIGDRVAVAAVGGLPAFDVELRKPAAPAPSFVTLPSGVPLFVLADTHGEYEIVVELLQAHKVIDRSLRWSFGDGHLVVLGDVFDRGAHQVEILWLLYKLEAEAQRAGGGLHALLGNHEHMVLSGDVRYLNAKYPRTAAALGAASYSALWHGNAVLGQWLRSRAAVMKIGDYLCAHGGVAPVAAQQKLSLQMLNDSLRDSLANRTALPAPAQSLATFVTGPWGPLWYRGYFPGNRQPGEPAHATADEVRQILAHYGVRRILVGHTRVPTVTPLYAGDVIAVQVYPQRDARSGVAVMEALRIDNGRLARARIDGTLEALKVGAP
jgi:hypothetical protein